MRKKKKAVPVSELARHQNFCAVCHHPQRDAIEREFVEWTPTSRIAREFHINRKSLPRHAYITGLVAKRDRNLKVALAKLILVGMTARKVSPAVTVQAIAVYSRLNARGEWVNRSETVSMNELFEKMTREEALAYAESGTLPSWFLQAIGRTGGEGESNAGV